MPLKNVKQLRDVQSCPKCFAELGSSCRMMTCPQLQFCKDSLATEMVNDLMADLSDRSGFGNVFDELDDEIKQEIIDTWKNIAAQYLKNA